MSNVRWIVVPPSVAFAVCFCVATASRVCTDREVEKTKQLQACWDAYARIAAARSDTTKFEANACNKP